MYKKFLFVILAIIFSLSLVGTSLAAKCKGTVVSVNNGKMVIEVTGKCNLNDGEKVTIKTKRKAIEGC